MTEYPEPANDNEPRDMEKLIPWDEFRQLTQAEIDRIFDYQSNK